MKNLKTIVLCAVAASLFFSFTTKTILPPAKKSSTAGAAVAKAPLIIATSNTAYYVMLLRSAQLSTTFDNLTDSFFGGNNLFMHWSTNASGPWTNGVLPYSASSPTYQYNFGSSFPSGTTVYVFFSTGTGTSYPAGVAASAIYSVVTP